MSETITYEQPLNERIRTFLRLEFLFKNLDAALEGESELDHRDVIQALSSILLVFDRSDLKQEIIKELERLISNLSALENTPGVDKKALEDLLGQLDQIVDSIQANKSAIGQALRDSDFLYGIRQRSSIPGGTCDFDLPAYHYWLLHSSLESRKLQLTEWASEFEGIRQAVTITLELIRGSTGFMNKTAALGFYQHSLNNNQSTQLIRIRIPREASYYPEISGGKHRFTVRFMAFDITQRSQQSNEDIEFSLSCCAM